MLNLETHRTVMFRLLSDFFRDTYLASVLGFKGGTACFFFHKLPRFSVDLDFDIATKKTDDKIGEEIFNKTRNIIISHGHKIRDEYLKSNTVFFLVSYSDSEQNIKIEVSRRDYPNSYEIRDFYGLPIKVMVKADMFAHKLVAASDRKKQATRDFFDIDFFFKNNWPINEEIILLRTGKSLKEYLATLKNYIEQNLTDKNILQGIGELIDAKQKTWIKSNLKKDLLQFISFKIDSGQSLT